MASHSVFEIEPAGHNELLDMEKAKEVGDTLAKHYSGHLWVVSVQGGVLVVKNLAISSFYGFIIKHIDSFSASDLAKKAVLAGGELLERAGIDRTKPWDGRMAEKLDGSDPRFFRNLNCD